LWNKNYRTTGSFAKFVCRRRNTDKLRKAAKALAL